MTATTKDPGTIVDDASAGTAAWTNPSNAGAADGAYASALLGNNATHYLKATNYGFDADIPANATIQRVKPRVDRKKSGLGNVKDDEARLVKSGSIVGHDKADTLTSWPIADAYADYDYSPAEWGVALTGADVRDSGFGFALRARSSSGPVAYVDHMPLVVTWSVPPVVSPSIDAFGRLLIAWQADDEGKVAFWLDGRQGPRPRGLLDRIVTVPSPSSPPTSGYNVKLVDRRGLDILGGAGAGRSATNPQPAWPYRPLGTVRSGEILVPGCLELKIDGAGSQGAGLLVCYLIPMDRS